jgi:hypothetical protein
MFDVEYMSGRVGGRADERVMKGSGFKACLLFVEEGGGRRRE